MEEGKCYDVVDIKLFQLKTRIKMLYFATNFFLSHNFFLPTLRLHQLIQTKILCFLMFINLNWDYISTESLG